MMMLKPKRLETFLESDGFQLSHLSKIEKLVMYSKSTNIPGIFEHIRISCGGKYGEVAGADAICSAAWGVIARWFVGRQDLIMELADPDGSGRHLFTSDQDVELWERRVAEHAPMRCRELTTQVGGQLRAETHEARQAAHRYLNLWLVDSEAGLREKMRTKSTPEQIAQAGKIARLPKVVLSFNKQEFYTDLILGLMHTSSEIDGRNIILEPWRTDWSDSTYQRIELIADRILHHDIFF